MAKRFHLFPFRTQQLSSFTPTILGLLDLGKLVNADTRAYEIYALRYSSIAQSVEHAAVNRRVVGSSPTGGATSERTLLRSDFSYAKNQSHVPSFLLFRKKARSARLFACKRTHNGLLSLPPFCDTGAFGAQISERFISSAPE